MKPKPLIKKNLAGWIVTRPGYGFAPTVTSEPYPTHAAALASLQPGAGTNAGSVVLERIDTPSGIGQSWSGYRFSTWPMEIR